MKIIVAIGGGNLESKSTLAIDLEIIRLTGKKHPRFLFIPTASTDSADYWNLVNRMYGNEYGCKTDVLNLITEKYSHQEIQKKIFSTDIVYVGGGNTLRMMRRWRRLGVDKLLKTAWQKGIVLCGVSAGAICWFDSGHSDSLSYYNPKKWNYINVKGLGFINGIHCPHYDSATLGVKRRKRFQEMIRKIGGFGIAIEDNCAIEFIDNKYRVINSKSNAKSFKVYKHNGHVIEREIEKIETFTPLEHLY